MRKITKQKIFQGFLNIFFLITFWYFGGSISWSLSVEYKDIIDKNIFSKERNYNPILYSEGKKENLKISEIEKGIIFRGIYIYGEKKWAIIEIKPYLKKRWNIPERKKLFSLGEELGPCNIKKIGKGKIILGGECEKIILSLRQSPERKKALSLPKKISPKVSTHSQQKKESKKTTKIKSKENPFKLLIQKNLKKQIHKK